MIIGGSVWIRLLENYPLKNDKIVPENPLKNDKIVPENPLKNDNIKPLYYTSCIMPVFLPQWHSEPY